MSQVDANPQIEESWKAALLPEFKQPYFAQLKDFLVEERKQHVVFPPGAKMFEAFNVTPLHSVRVVILGQDPYHGRAGMAYRSPFPMVSPSPIVAQYL